LTHADEPKGDLAKLQGTWTTKVGSKKDIQASMIVKDSTIEIKLTRPDNQEITLKGEMKLDEKASPKTADWVKFTGPGGQEIPAIKLIYKLEGDTWTTCSSGPDVERPTKFEGGDGPGMPTLDVWTRAKEKVESPVPKSE
jgi:uncharacterized protein (TIGR03067 family)